MRIGIDFDNTIACYDGVFHAAALERGLIPAETPTNKGAVRDYLRGIDREGDWTELQGWVYGERMDLAKPYAGAIQVIGAFRAAGHTVRIVSHKTKTPYAGPAYDLHAAARGFLAAHGLVELLGEANIYFELTKEAKLARIGDLGCEVFIDDLPEFLAEPAFPKQCRAILFDPESHHEDETRFDRAESWAAVQGLSEQGHG